MDCIFQFKYLCMMCSAVCCAVGFEVQYSAMQCNLGSVQLSVLSLVLCSVSSTRLGRFYIYCARAVL